MRVITRKGIFVPLHRADFTFCDFFSSKISVDFRFTESVVDARILFSSLLAPSCAHMTGSLTDNETSFLKI